MDLSQLLNKCFLFSVVFFFDPLDVITHHFIMQKLSKRKPVSYPCMPNWVCERKFIGESIRLIADIMEISRQKGRLNAVGLLLSSVQNYGSGLVCLQRYL